MDDGQTFRNRVILITGASGFTGTHACAYFAELGMQVAALVRHKEKYAESKVKTIRYYSCDLLDPQQIGAVVKEIAPDYVLHLGGKNSVSESWDHPLLYLETNVMSVVYLLEALRPYQSCRILIAGSRLSSEQSAPYCPKHPYGFSKSLQKTVALSWKELFGQYVMVAEPSNLVGPGVSSGVCSLLGRHIVRLEQGEESGPFRLSSRFLQRDFLDVRDAVRAYGYLLIGGMNGEVYPVCSGLERNFVEVVETMQTIVGKEIVIAWNDVPTLAAAQPSSVPVYLNRLGWRPQISFSSSLTDVIGYYRAAKGEI